MILHYLKVAFRNLWKYRTHSLISMLFWLFGRVYILTYLIVFAIVLPLGKQVAIIAFQEFDAPYRWDWAIGIFFGMALLIFLVTAFKIWRIMHVNPANIIKKE